MQYFQLRAWDSAHINMFLKFLNSTCNKFIYIYIYIYIHIFIYIYIYSFSAHQYVLKATQTQYVMNVYKYIILTCLADWWGHTLIHLMSVDSSIPRSHLVTLSVFYYHLTSALPGWSVFLDYNREHRFSNVFLCSIFYRDRQ